MTARFNDESTDVALPFDRPPRRRGPGPLAEFSIPWVRPRLIEAGHTDPFLLAAWAVVLACYGSRTRLTVPVASDQGRIGLQLAVERSAAFSDLMDAVSESLAAAEPLAGDASALFVAGGAVDDNAPEVPLVLGVRHDPDEIWARFDTTRLDESTVHRVLGHIATVVNQIGSRGAGVAVGDLTVASAEELGLLESWNDTGRVFGDGGESLASLFVRAVSDFGDLAAVGFGDRSVSYAELGCLARVVADRLARRGVGAGSLVGVVAERSVELVAGLYGVGLVGAGYVPLDPDYPRDRLGYMISETGMDVVLCQDRFVPLVKGLGVDVVDITTLDADPDAGLDSFGGVGCDEVAYVIYTSGSTGRPKGVANTHRGVVNRLLWMQDRYPLGPGNVVLQKTPFSFDVSVWEFFWPLQVGATLVVAEPEGHKDPAYLVETINSHLVDTIHFVPSMLRLFLDHPAARTCRSLQRVICSGEALTRDLQDRFFEVFPDVELHNLYGPTEAAIDVTAWQCQPQDTLPVVPIGAPIANCTIDILDPNMAQVPIGTPGELYIGGVQVAAGYVNRPDLTQERFIPDPHRPRGRLYKTGDLARWLPNGTIDFLGRLDHQIKLRGQRIELGEIEASLGEHPAVLEAAITAIDSILVAHVMWRGAPVSDATLKAYLGQRLPPSMVPSRFVSYAALPLTTSGKVDRNQLTDRLAPTSGKGEDGSDPLEQMLLGIWRRVLANPEVGARDRVFDLGATSLQAAAFVNEVQRQFDEFIYVVTVFTSPTVAEYAAFLTEHYPDAVRRRLGVDIVAADRKVAVVDDEHVATMDSLVPDLGPFPGWHKRPPNPAAAFILAPPRSGTTLLRVMLAGHSKIFAAPELQLLGFDTLAQRRASLSGRFSPWLEGTIRTLMELEDCGPEEATSLMEGFEADDLTCKEFFASLQDRADGRLVVDKSPAYALDIDVLRNAEAGFDRPRYLHLVREPGAMSRSFESYHMDQILYLHDNFLAPRTLGELVWTVSHRNILYFAQEIDEDRLMTIRFEELVADPYPVMERVADFLGMAFEDSLVKPYEGLESKMVDGLHPASTPMGDTRLLEHDGIDPSLATKWAGGDGELGVPTQRLAQRLGYGITTDAGRRRGYADSLRRRRQGGES